MLTRVAFNRFLGRAMSTSGLSLGTLSAMHCARNLLCVRRNGGGRVCGVTLTAWRRNVPCWRRGRSSGRPTGSNVSIRPTTRENWSRCARVCHEVALSASRSGKNRSRIDWAWSRPFVQAVDRRRWAVPRAVHKPLGGAPGNFVHRCLSPRPPLLESAPVPGRRGCRPRAVKLPPDIGPVPLRFPDLSRFAFNIGPVPLRFPEGTSVHRP
jgi:hypothetical protein